MKKLTLFALCVALILSAAPLVAKKADEPCNPAGTWWGVNKTFKLYYVLTIVPMGDGLYSVTADENANPPLAPWQRATDFRGQLTHLKNKRYDFKQLSLANPALVSSQVMDVLAVSGKLRMNGCDRLTIKFDVGGVWAWGQTPLVDEPALDMLEGVPGHVMVGKYRRLQ